MVLSQSQKCPCETTWNESYSPAEAGLLTSLICISMFEHCMPRSHAHLNCGSPGLSNNLGTKIIAFDLKVA